jgi:tyrosinase
VPHNRIHVLIGGTGGFMSDPATAALDPIFWLHHCNIDRLWNKWLAGGGGRSNPPVTDVPWHTQNFTFFDETGAQVQMNGGDIVDAANSSCRSCYDEEAFYIIYDLTKIRYRYRDLIIGVIPRPLQLDAKTLRFDLELNDKARSPFASAVKGAARPEDELNIRLNFENVKADKPVEFYYEVYINLPTMTGEPNFRMDSYAGNLSFFGADSDHNAGDMQGMKHGEMEPLKFSVNITDAIRRLKLNGVGKVSITLVPTGLVDKAEKRLPIRSEARISVGQVTLSVQEREK